MQMDPQWKLHCMLVLIPASAINQIDAETADHQQIYSFIGLKAFTEADDRQARS